MVSEPMLGMIRLQWWQEAMDELFDPNATVRRHEVTLALEVLLADTPLSKSHFTALIEAHKQELESLPFVTITDFEHYSEQTSGALLLLALEILGVKDKTLQHMARHTGIAWSIITYLRTAHRDLPRNFCVIPQDILQTHGLSLDRFGSEDFAIRFQSAVKTLSETAESHLTDASNLLASVAKPLRKQAKPVWLLLPLARFYLDAIRQKDGDILRQALPAAPSPLTLLSLWFKAARNRV